MSARQRIAPLEGLEAWRRTVPGWQARTQGASHPTPVLDLQHGSRPDQSYMPTLSKPCICMPPCAINLHQSQPPCCRRGHTVTNHAYPASTSSYLAPCFECLVKGPADLGGWSNMPRFFQSLICHVPSPCCSLGKGLRSMVAWLFGWLVARQQGS